MAILIDLWPDGQVVDKYPGRVTDGSRTIIYPDDEERFAAFLRAAPVPTFMEKIKVTQLGDAVGMAWVWLIMLTIFGGLSWCLGAAGNALRAWWHGNG